MMRKGELTREMILRQAMPVFNRQGYFGTSIADIMRATGLDKGGIYNHFAGKDELALEAFDYAVAQVRAAFGEAMRDRPHSLDRLQAMLDVYRHLAQGSLIPGGCPVLNTAVEADDAHPALRQRARLAMEGWRVFIERTVARGIRKGEIRPETDPAQVETLLIATIEGGVMLSRLCNEPADMERLLDHLSATLQSLARP